MKGVPMEIWLLAALFILVALLATIIASTGEAGAILRDVVGWGAILITAIVALARGGKQQDPPNGGASP